jgi:SAM-dependent methyltransferase
MPYPEALIDFVAERCGTSGDRVLDLGCGPGVLAVAFARRGFDVTGLDPEPAMLAAAAQHARAQGVAIKLIEGSSYDLGRHQGPFRFVLMGRSFHWMDRDATLRLLDRNIEATGAVVLFGDRRIATPGADWPSLLRNLAIEFVPAQATRSRRKDPNWEANESILMRSAFAHLTLHGMTVVRRLSVEDIVGLAYSMSGTSVDALGPDRRKFEERLRAGLTGLGSNGQFQEIVEVRAVIARRIPGW